jgi:hypothetical protein
MDVTDIRVLSTVGLLVVGVVTVVGAMAVSLLAAWLIEASVAAAAWFARLRSRVGGAPRPARTDLARGALPGLGFEVEGEHALLARQAQHAPQVPQASWWARC